MIQALSTVKMESALPKVKEPCGGGGGGTNRGRERGRVSGR